MAPHVPTTPEERLLALELHVQHTHDLMLDMHTRLFGKQPGEGELALLGARVGRLEAYHQKVKGFLAACSALGGIIGAIVGALVAWWKRG